MMLFQRSVAFRYSCKFSKVVTNASEITLTGFLHAFR